LLLIPFVENAFKHLSHDNNRLNYVKVDLERGEDHFMFAVENSKELNGHTTELRGGIGLPNVKRRLELLYPGKHQLNISETDRTFSVRLNIQLT
jgi:two-component system LytT family sensor kinase